MSVRMCWEGPLPLLLGAADRPLQLLPPTVGTPAPDGEDAVDLVQGGRVGSTLECVSGFLSWPSAVLVCVVGA